MSAFSLLYRFTAAKLRAPTVSAKSPSAQNPPAPDPLVQLGALLAPPVARAACELLHHLGYRLRGVDWDHQVDVLRQDLPLLAPPPVDLGRLLEPPAQADGSFALPHPPAVLRDPHEMVPEPASRVTPGPLSERQADILPRFGFVPGLKAGVCKGAPHHQPFGDWCLMFGDYVVIGIW